MRPNPGPPLKPALAVVRKNDSVRIRPADPADLPLLQDLERAAGEPFRALGMAAIADDEPPTSYCCAVAQRAHDGPPFCWRSICRPEQQQSEQPQLRTIRSPPALRRPRSRLSSSFF